MPDREVLVRIADRGPGEADSKRGDIIAVQDAGFAWSAEELNNDFWLILAISSLLDIDRDAMLAQRTTGFRGERFRRREWFVDFSVLPFPTRFAFPRTQQKVNLTRLGFIAALTQKPALV